MPENFYDLLGVDKDATKEELKRAYRQRAREFHPDVNADDRAGAQFKTVRRAYDVLSDETERSAYDRLGHETYVRKRMKGLPKESSSNGSSSQSAQTTTRSSRSSSRTSRSGTSSRSGSRSNSSTRWNGSTGNQRQRSRQTGQRTRQSSESTSRQSNTSGTTRTRSGPQYTYPNSQQRTSSRDRLRNRWLVVTATFALYLGGLAQFVLANQSTLSDLATALSTDPVGTLTAAGGFGTPAAFVTTALTTATVAPSPALLLPVGMVAFPLALAWTVTSFGHGSAWLYVVATFCPLIAFGAGLVVPAVPTAVDLLAFAGLPVVAGLLFLGDVGRYLFATR